MRATSESERGSQGRLSRRTVLALGGAALGRLMLPVALRAGAAGDLEIADITWTLGPDFPELRKGGSLGTLEGRVIAAGGMQHPWRESPTTFAYTPGSGEWERLPDMPEGRVYMDGVAVGDAFYVVGGRHDGATRSDVFRLRRQTDRWQWDRVPSLRGDRGWFALDRLGTKMIAAGGNRFGPGEGAFTPDSTLATAEWLDTTRLDAGWQPLPDFPGQSRGWIAGAAVAGRFYIFGGSHHLLEGGKRVSPRLTEAAVFDPASQEWSRLPELPYPVSGLDAVAYRDRYVVLLGGAAFMSDEQKARWPQEDGHYSNVVLVFDTQTRNYYPMPSPMPYATNDIRATIVGDHIFALGGENIEPATSNTTKWLRVGQIQLAASTRER